MTLKKKIDTLIKRMRLIERRSARGKQYGMALMCNSVVYGLEMLKAELNPADLKIKCREARGKSQDKGRENVERGHEI